jgi:DNA-binding transcriptional LysR family regulator
MRHLKIYRAIRLIVREGSIRQAASMLSVSPSALNRSVQAFEEEMGLEVFERIPSGVRLSSAGQLLMDMIDRHLTEFDEMQGQLNDMHDGLTGVLRISVGSDVNAGALPCAVAAFEQDNAGVSVEIVTDDTPTPLASRAVDLAVLTNPITDDAVEVLYSQTVPLAAWKAGGIAEGVDLWDLTNTRLLLPPHGTGTRAAIAHLLRRRRLEEGVSTTLTAADVPAHFTQTPLVSILPETSFTATPLATRLALPLGDIQVSVLRAVRVPLTRSAQAFLALLQRELDARAPTASSV